MRLGDLELNKLTPHHGLIVKFPETLRNPLEEIATPL